MRLIHVVADSKDGLRPAKTRCGRKSADLAASDICARSSVGAVRKAMKSEDGLNQAKLGRASFCTKCVAGLALLLALCSFGCATAGGFARGAYAPEYEPLRSQMGVHLARVLEVAKVDVAELRSLLVAANEREPGTGTGALIQRVMLLIALELATGGELEARPAAPGGSP